MRKSGKHIIHKLNIEVDVPDLATARRIHDNSLEFFYTDVFPRLEELLGTDESEDIYYRSGSLDLEFDFRSEEDFKSEFTSALVEEMKHHIMKTISEKQGIRKTKDSHFEQRSSTKKQLEVFLYFLKTGQLPWFASTVDEWLEETRILEVIRESRNESGVRLGSFLMKYPNALRRLIKQFSTQFLVQIVREEIPVAFYPRILREILAAELAQVRKSDAMEINLLIEEIQMALIHRQKQYSESLFEDSEIDNELEKIEWLVDDTDGEEENGLFLSHSGLVLLHPYLEHFFEEFDLLEEDQFASENAKQTAIHLLYYLATGKSDPVEYDLGMEKYLCGWPQEIPVERSIDITERMKEEAEKMLKAVIFHWKILKNSSPDALREAFLQRNGKLIQNNLQHRLIVESSTIDILLDFLPWNYSIITLPWMSKVLHVEWQINCS